METTRLQTVLLCLLSSGALLAAGCSANRITADPVYYPAAPSTARVVHLKSFNALSGIVAPKPSLLEMLRGGAVSPFVASPRGIASAGDMLFICDIEKAVVHAWNLRSGKAKQLGRGDEGALMSPVDVAVGGDGHVYVADTGRESVFVFDSAGEFVAQIAPERENFRPAALEVVGRHEGSAGGILAVADTGGHELDFFVLPEAQQHYTWAEMLEAHADDFPQGDRMPAAFAGWHFPAGMAVHPSGAILVSEMLRSRVKVFGGSNEEPYRTIGQAGARYGDLGRPRHLDLSPDGDVLFIADPQFAHLHLFNLEGQLLMLLGGPQGTAGGTPMPYGVAVAPSLPEPIAKLVPEDFAPAYFLFVTNTVGEKRISLFAVGQSR